MAGTFFESSSAAVVLQFFCTGCFKRSPPATSSIFSVADLISLTGAWNGGSWLGCRDLPAMGAVFYLGAG